MPQGAPVGLRLIDKRLVDERPRDLVVGRVALRLEDPQDRLHGAVGRRSFLQGADHIRYGRGLTLPEDGHHAGFGVGQGGRFAAGHL